MTFTEAARELAKTTPYSAWEIESGLRSIASELENQRAPDVSVETCVRYWKEGVGAGALRVFGGLALRPKRTHNLKSVEHRAGHPKTRGACRCDALIRGTCAVCGDEDAILNQPCTGVRTTMPMEEAKALLAACRRCELRDHAFGDAEVTWERGPHGDGAIYVATGFFGGEGSTVSIYLFDAKGQHVMEPERGLSWAAVHFDGEDARALRSCGARGAVERNDSTWPDRYAEGQTMRGLTSEGVLDEITRRDDS